MGEAAARRDRQVEVDRQQRSGAAWTGRKSLALYLMAGVIYTTLGILFPELLFSWWEGVPFLLVFVWAAHALRKRYG